MKKAIVFGKTIPIDYKDLEGENYDGLYNYKTQHIEIDKKLKGDYKTAVIIHELLHAMWDRIAFNQANIPHSLQEILIENTCTMLIENFNIKPKV